MRFLQMTLAAAAILVSGAFGYSIAAESPRAQSAANNNASRPGAGAPNCAKLEETSDRCVFHTRKGQIDTVRLPMSSGVTWTATASDATLIEIGPAKVETRPDGSKQHVIQVVPQTAADADVVLKLEKRSASAGVTETRNINLMIHAIAPASGS